MNLSSLEKRGFRGIDCNLDISLGDYGAVWKVYRRRTGNIARHETKFVYCIPSRGNDTVEYSVGFFNFLDTHVFREFDWIEWDRVNSFVGYNVYDTIRMLDMQLANSEISKYDYCDAISLIVASDLLFYYGSENIFGTDYYGGFHIGGLS
jgi:hypothetical protein